MLSYCTNIHSGEDWAAIHRNLRDHVVAVKQRVAPAVPFPVGLRVSGHAAFEIDDDEADRFGDWLTEHGCFVVSLNGFPYGPFHGAAVKEKVYLPDWRDETRVTYSRRLADLLARWLPAGLRGSISTVPVAFKRGFDDDDWPSVRRNLMAVLEHLHQRYEHTGADISLAVEPEPACVLETSRDVISFFERMDVPERLARHLGLCYDCCHQAVAFEDPATSLMALADAGVHIAKVQVSSSLRAVGHQIREIDAFAEPTYLHQVVARHRDGRLERFDDLPDFLAHRSDDVEECRVHFHVPIFAEEMGGCGTTRFFLEDLLPRLDPGVFREVETYSWAALPPDMRRGTIVDSIVRELRWAQEASASCTERPSSMLSA